ncbi:MAG TPA: ABC transporter permease [Methylomirabilota bacterium]|jgi:NitT/TauT family transport system permease protein|nr:ABC transporter permease [Methylomirabilota bacterium]
MNEEITAPTPPVTAARADRRGLVAAILYPLAAFALLLLGWQFLVRAFGVPEYILPVPSEFMAKLAQSRGLIWQHTLVTAKEILWGFFFATLISVPLGFLIVSIRFLELSLYPLIVFFQLVPKIAVAPLFVVWFGFGPFPKVLFTFLLCFFPTLVASMAGFRSLDERVLYLTRSMGASWWQTFRYIRLPSALGYIFSGLKVSIVFAATGAIVAEFVGANAGLGYLLLRGTSYLDMPLIFAVLVALSLVGLLFSYAVQALETVLMPWQRKS